MGVFTVPKLSTLHNTPYICSEEGGKTAHQKYSSSSSSSLKTPACPAPRSFPVFAGAAMPAAIFALSSGQRFSCWTSVPNRSFPLQTLRPSVLQEKCRERRLQSLPSSNTGRGANLFSPRDVRPPALSHCGLVFGRRQLISLASLQQVRGLQVVFGHCGSLGVEGGKWEELKLSVRKGGAKLVMQDLST